MKKILLLLIKICSGFLRIIKWPLDRLIYYSDILRIYLTGRECEKFSDCLLLAKLKAGQPPASDRFIEYPWLLENINITEGRLLDIGSTIGDQLYETLPKTVEINCLNLSAKKFKNQRIEFKQGDIRQTDYPDNYFDLIACVSTLEHIGVGGRYGSDFDEQGDLKATREIKRILKPGGILLATVPYGAKDVLPINKLYDKNRISDLFSGFNIISQEFKKFDKNWHVWLKVSEAEAAKTDMLRDGWYALCLIKAKKL
jgi:SAM-dependent methyltransferase